MFWGVNEWISNISTTTTTLFDWLSMRLTSTTQTWIHPQQFKYLKKSSVKQIVFFEGEVGEKHGIKIQKKSSFPFIRS